MNRYILRRFFAFGETPYDNKNLQSVANKIKIRCKRLHKTDNFCSKAGVVDESVERRFWRLWVEDIFEKKGDKKYVEDSYKFMCAKTDFHNKIND